MTTVITHADGLISTWADGIRTKHSLLFDHFKWLRISTYLTFHSNIFPRFWHTNWENAVTHEQSLNESIGMNAEYKRFVEWGELNKNMEKFQWLSKNEAHIFNRINISFRSVVYITFSFCHIHSNAIHMREKRVEECKHFTEPNMPTHMCDICAYGCWRIFSLFITIHVFSCSLSLSWLFGLSVGVSLFRPHCLQNLFGKKSNGDLR